MSTGTFLGGLLVGFGIGLMLMSTLLKGSLQDTIILSKNEFKCHAADIIDNDPSNTDCTVYIKKNSNVEQIIKE